MMKKTHIMIGAAASAMVHGLDPVAAGGAVLGSLVPDFDLWIPGVRHRTITHWILWPVILWVLPLGIFADALAIGWLAHIAADCLTVSGLHPFGPLPFHIRGPIRTGGAGEYAFVGLLSVMIGAMVVL